MHECYEAGCHSKRPFQDALQRELQCESCGGTGHDESSCPHFNLARLDHPDATGLLRRGHFGFGETPDVAPVAAPRRLDVAREREEKEKDDPRAEPTLRVKLVAPGRDDVPPEKHLWTDANDDDEELQRSCFVLLFGATPRSAGGAALVCSSDDAALEEAAIDADTPKDFQGCPSLVCADGEDAAAGAPDDLEEPESAFALARRSSDSVRKYMCAEDADSAARDPCGNELPWDEDESDDGVPLTE